MNASWAHIFTDFYFRFLIWYSTSFCLILSFNYLCFCLPPLSYTWVLFTLTLFSIYFLIIYTSILWFKDYTSEHLKYDFSKFSFVIWAIHISNRFDSFLLPYYFPFTKVSNVPFSLFSILTRFQRNTMTFLAFRIILHRTSFYFPFTRIFDLHVKDDIPTFYSLHFSVKFILNNMSFLWEMWSLDLQIGKYT